jgi:hypothetical protein
MPFDLKKKVAREPGPPDYRLTNALSSIDRAFSELTRTLLSVSSSHREMKAIVNHIGETIDVAKRWVIDN